MKQQRCRSWFPLGATVAVEGTPSPRPWADGRGAQRSPSSPRVSTWKKKSAPRIPPTSGRTPQDPVERAAARGWAEFGRRRFCVWVSAGRPDGRLVAELESPGAGWVVVARCDGAPRMIELVETVEKVRRF